ncbi:MAG TPA: hypothetical protein VGP83_17140 [Pyrinomonadaceae bacterium]|jgi:hypothetical protein|nr:hypothetical protein [Pyrinomonadaceae bacterium]
MQSEPATKIAPEQESAITRIIAFLYDLYVNKCLESLARKDRLNYVRASSNTRLELEWVRYTDSPDCLLMIRKRYADGSTARIVLTEREAEVILQLHAEPHTINELATTGAERKKIHAC